MLVIYSGVFRHLCFRFPLNYNDVKLKTQGDFKRKVFSIPDKVSQHTYTTLSYLILSQHPVAIHSECSMISAKSNDKHI